MMQLSELLTRTTELLSNAPSLNESQIPLLQEVLRAHNGLYYTEQSPIISDQEYDTLFRTLKALEEQYGVWDPTSPTKRIDVLVSSQFQKGLHASQMISLDNTYDENDIADFEGRIRNVLRQKNIEILSDSALSYAMELKFDGLGLSLTYRNGELIRALTRGN